MGIKVGLGVAVLCAGVGFLPPALAQTSPGQTPKVTQAAIYAPTSLVPEPGLPRTPDGHPDFQDVVWNADFFAYLQSPGSLVVSEEQAKVGYQRMMATLLASPLFALDPETPELMKRSEGFPIVRGQRRSRLLVLPADGRMPFTPAATKEIQAGQLALLNAARADNPEERTPN